MNLCTACGSGITAEAKFCPGCGAAATQASAQPGKRKYSVKKIVLIVIGVIVLGRAVYGFLWGWTHAAEVIEAAAETSPKSGSSGNPVAPAAPRQTSAKAPDVVVYIVPEAEDWLKSVGLTEDAIKDAAHRAVVNDHIECISENAVFDGSDDWVSIRLTKSSANGFAAEMSVVNGASVNNQLIRWASLKPIGATSTDQDLLAVMGSLVSELASAYNTPEYRKGRIALQ